MISNLLGFDSDYIIIALLVIVIALFVLLILIMKQMSDLKKNYKIFMSGKSAKNLEDTLVKRLDQIDNLIAANSTNEKNIKKLFNKQKFNFQKVGLIKYDALHEMGGKLSFSLALLNESDTGFVMNAVHSREGCYTYVKEIIDGNAIITLSDEEKEALDMAKEQNKPSEKKK